MRLKIHTFRQILFFFFCIFNLLKEYIQKCVFEFATVLLSVLLPSTKEAVVFIHCHTLHQFGQNFRCFLTTFLSKTSSVHEGLVVCLLDLCTAIIGFSN